MALYQSGFKPAGGHSIEDARAQQQEQAAKQHALQMQRQTFQWELDKRKDDQARTSMYEFFNTQSRKYDPNNLLENMLKSRQPGVPAPKIEQVRGFTADKKQEAFDAYKRIAVNPDINWFEEMWASSKAGEDKKIAMELIQDYNVGKITEKEFNLASRNQNFQDWYRKAKLDDETAGALADIYKPGYSTFSETFFGREGAPGQAGQNIIMRNLFPAAGVGAATVATGAGVAKVMHDKTAMEAAEESLKKAKKLGEKYKTGYQPIEGTFKAAGTTWEEAQKTKGFDKWLKLQPKLDEKGNPIKGEFGPKPSKDRYNKFMGEQYEALKRKADAGVKSAQKQMQVLESRGLIKKIGGSWTKLPGFARGVGVLGAVLAAEPLVRTATKALGGSEKTADIGAHTVRAGLAMKFTKDQVKRNVINRLEKGGMKNVAKNFSKIIDKKGWGWVLRTAGKKSPMLLAKVAGKLGAGAIGGSLTGGAMAVGMAAWTAKDLWDLYHAVAAEAD